MLEQVLVHVALGVEHEPLLAELKLVEHEHDPEAQEQRDEGGVEGGAEAGGDPRDVALDRTVGLVQKGLVPMQGRLGAVNAGFERMVELAGRFRAERAFEFMVMGLDKALARVREIERLVERGDPAKRILEEASREEVDVVVMGTRGLSDLQGLPLPSQ